MITLGVEELVRFFLTTVMTHFCITGSLYGILEVVKKILSN